VNLAEAEGLIDSVPFKGLKALKENNVRDRVLSGEEYERLLAQCPPHTAQVVKMAYYTAMRQGEILNLAWDRIDIKTRVVRLKPEDTKTNEPRTIPLHREIIELLKALPRSINGRVFTMEGVSIGEIKRSFTTACKNAGIENFTFHDLRHTAINNWRLQGHDFFRIMAASGHRTMEVFKRYNTVSEEELMKLVETPMDTSKEKGLAEIV
jgi:integrase